MTRSKSSSRWLQEHFTDPYVKRAQMEGYRSRAAYKLLAIQEKDRIIKPGMMVADLGAAPGSWSQVAQRLVGEQGRVFALDRLPMDPLTGVTFIQGDFTENEAFEQLLAAIGQQPIDLVIADMAPNISGNKHIDVPQSILLAELTLDFAKRTLKPQGSVLMKIFQGAGLEMLLREMRGTFKQIVQRKPEASRARSKEIYVLGKGYWSK